MRNRGRRHCAEKASQRINQYYNTATQRPTRITSTTRAVSSRGRSIRQRRPSPHSCTVVPVTSATPVTKKTAVPPSKHLKTVPPLSSPSPQQSPRKRLGKAEATWDSSREARNAVKDQPRENPTPTPVAASAAKASTASDRRLPKVDKRQEKGNRVIKDSQESRQVKELLKKVLKLQSYKNVGVQTSPPEKRTVAPPPPPTPTVKQEPPEEEELAGDSKIPFRLAQVKVEPEEEPVDQEEEEEDLKPLAIIQRDDNYKAKRSGCGSSSDDVTCEVQ